MILITGVTEQYGQAVIDHLSKSGIIPNTIMGLVRSSEKAKVFSEKGIFSHLDDYYDSDNT